MNKPPVTDFVGVSTTIASPGRDTEKLLSLSFWRDEAAVAQWRNLEAHRAAQAAGRDHVLGDYRLRVAQVMRDYGMSERAEAPSDSRQANG